MDYREKRSDRRGLPGKVTKSNVNVTTYKDI